ncbi:DUF11 domain-containing protein, partial [Streptomyces tsukubensis]|uniref:DUF11 domain-containing protein n=1 Tax=Streptomyces tsukubensis TaxID=83656 RepID=UPI00344B7915
MIVIRAQRRLWRAVAVSAVALATVCTPVLAQAVPIQRTAAEPAPASPPGPSTAKVTPAKTAPDSTAEDAKAPGQRALQTPWSCNGQIMVVSGPNPVQLYTGATGAGTITFSPVGSPQPLYNAIAVDPSTDIMYAMQGSAQELVEVNPDGSTTNVGAVAGLPAQPTPYNSGGFDGSGNYWITNSGMSTLYEIDVSNATLVQSLALTQTVQLADITFSNGFFWGANPAGVIIRIDPTTGTTTNFSSPLPVAPNYGGMFTYGDGSLGFVSNGGNLYRVQVTNPASASPTFTLLSTQASPTTFVNLDATSCFGSDVDLGIAKTGPASVAPGGAITYTLTVTNDGPDDSSGYTVTDTIPAGLNNAATTTPGCSITGGTLSCTSGPLANGASNTITLTGTAATSGVTSISNTADVLGNDPDPNPANNQSTATTTVASEVDLALTKTGPATVDAGGNVSYTLTVTNDGPGNSTGYTVTDAIPAGLNNAATTTAGCSITAGTLSCTGGPLAVGASTTITLTGTAAAGATSIVNTADVTGNEPDPNPANNTDSVTTAVTPEVDLALTKTGPATVDADGVVSYTITVTNDGPSNSTGYTVTDAIPAGLNNAASTTAGCSIAAGTLSCTGGPLANGSSTTIALTGTAAADATSIVNTADVTGNEPDPNPANNTDSVTTAVTPEVDLALTKTGPATVDADGNISYTITVTNDGPSDSTGFTVTDAIPAGLNNAATTTAGCSIAAGTLSCTGGPLAVGASATITLTGTAAAGVTSITNTADVTGNEPDPNPANNTDTVTTTVTPEVDLALTKTGPATVDADGNISYTITVTNDGPSGSTGYTVTDTIPAGLNNAATTTAGCSIAAGTLSCTGGPLAVGASTTIALTGTAAADATSIVNIADVTGNEPDPNPANNTDTVTTTVT